MKSRRVILSHLHDMIASGHLAIMKMLHTQCPVAHQSRSQSPRYPCPAERETRDSDNLFSIILFIG